MYSSRHIEARQTAMIISVSPVLALVLAWIFLRDVPANKEILGGSLIVLALDCAITK